MPMADTQPAAGLLQPLAARKTALLTTFRRDGTPVGTPVTIVVDGGRAFFRTYDKAWKARRLRNNPEVEVAPATVSGKPRGEPIHGRTRLLSDEEAAHARRLIARRSPFLQGVVVPLNHRLMRRRTLHYELVPSEPA
jgi:PPOX class probable F420-dependent enzyme